MAKCPPRIASPFPRSFYIRFPKFTLRMRSPPIFPASTVLQCL